MVAAKKFVSPQQYLIREQQAELRSEYWNGEIVAMVSGSPAHNRILRNLTRRLGNQLDGSLCEAYASETRVYMPQCNAYFYPDALIVCGDVQLQDGVTETILNPTAVIELLSPTTETADRGRKFACYRTLPSLQFYVLIQQDAPAIEVYAQQADNRWLLTVLTELEATLALETVGVVLPFSEIYQGVDFPPLPAIPDEALLPDA
jgi:Uma2 family endonuclease